ncbi:MAG: peptidoglycan DD-metalloendopeptidase family protein, partial [bacterium]|nr:peptidoglycan DD-metalloendopeptidase family protein [bacterium]
EESDENLVSINIPDGITFSKLMQDLNIAPEISGAILDSSKPVYDLSTIVSNHELTLALANSDASLRRLIYKIDSNRELVVTKVDSDQAAATSTNNFIAKVQPIPYEIKIAELRGIIDTSLYEAFIAADQDVRLALSVAEIFAWQVDFAADIRSGDSFQLVYEKRFLDGKYIMPGKILGAQFINDGHKFQGFYFGSDNTEVGYYDEEGNSLQKQFLKSPLQYKYISSGFSYARVNPVTKKVSPHRGIDYAANYGTPAVSVGDGTIVQAGWNGPYGISATVRHNETYTTVYGHFSSLAKSIRVGAKIKQGQIVGYVGATGEATGPHLHYEMHKFGGYVNPFTEEIPPGNPIAEIDRVEFNKLVADNSFD